MRVRAISDTQRIAQAVNRLARRDFERHVTRAAGRIR